MVSFEAETPGNFQQNICSVDARLDEGIRIHDRPVDVGFGREVYDSVDIVCSYGAFHVLTITDVALDESVTRIILDGDEIIEVARICQLVIHDDTVILVVCQHIMDEIRPDEACSAGDQYILQQNLLNHFTQISQSRQIIDNEQGSFRALHSERDLTLATIPASPTQI